jgi:hypothetical protein
MTVRAWAVFRGEAVRVLELAMMIGPGAPSHEWGAVATALERLARAARDTQRGQLEIELRRSSERVRVRPMPAAHEE